MDVATAAAMDAAMDAVMDAVTVAIVVLAAAANERETERSDAFFHKQSRPSSPCPVCTVPLRPFTMEAHS